MNHDWRNSNGVSANSRAATWVQMHYFNPIPGARLEAPASD